MLCPVCNSSEMEIIVDLGNQPLANKYPKAEEFKKEFFAQMRIYWCSDCLFLHLPCSAPRETFFLDYYYLSSVNKELVDHFTSLANSISKYKPNFVLDIGSNDGVLLRPLKDLGIKCLGVDPSVNVGAIANNEGLTTEIGFFNSKMAKKIKNNYGDVDFIVASSVFTHLESPREFMVACNEILTMDGKILIEVEYPISIFESLGFERFYFDRPSYYSLHSFQSLAAEYDFEVSDATKISPHGGSIQVVLQRAQCKDKKSIQAIEDIFAEETSNLSKEKIINAFNLFNIEITKLKEGIRSFQKSSRKILAYGCPARFSTITNYGTIETSYLNLVIDDSPLKQNSYSPGQHIPIKSADYDSEDIDIYIVFAYEYVDSIKNKVKSKNAKFYRPVPFTEI